MSFVRGTSSPYSVSMFMIIIRSKNKFLIASVDILTSKQASSIENLVSFEVDIPQYKILNIPLEKETLRLK